MGGPEFLRLLWRGLGDQVNSTERQVLLEMKLRRWSPREWDSDLKKNFMKYPALF